MADIKIANATYSDVTQVALKSPSGEDILFSLGGSGGSEFKYSGKNAELVSRYEATWNLADTSFVIGTGASSTTIRASESAKFVSPTLSIGDRDVVVVQRCLATPIHGSGASGKAQQVCFAELYVTIFAKRKTSDTSVNTIRESISLLSYILKYKNSGGVDTRVKLQQYGFYFGYGTASIGSTTAESTTVKCSSPALFCKTSSTYESSANVKTVTECEFKWIVDVYLVDANTSIQANLHDEVDKMIINGLE